MKQPKRISASELAKVGIQLVRRKPPILQCQRCGAEWRALRFGLATRHHQYWICQNGCNTNMNV
jgi:hypothetical protein